MIKNPWIRGNVTVIFLLILSALIVYGVLGVINGFNQKDRKLEEEIKKHRQELLEKNKIIENLGVKLERAWGQDLIARLHVKSIDYFSPNEPKMDVVFIQYERGNEKKPIIRSEFSLVGDSFHVDSWVINFDRLKIENGDPLRGKSIATFRRAYGNKQSPDDGVALHQSDWIPPEFKVADNPKFESFERELWQKFWSLASDQREAQLEGVDSAYGSGVFMRAQQGQDYKIMISNNVKMSIHPERDPELLPQRPEGSF
ncbi:hypothetical protein KKB55_20925 [Myxococcota bacterium]|nr:hypothetical protein [Myxococcota bacterium]